MTIQFRRILGTLLGLAFNGARDLYQTFGYQRQLSYQDMLLRYSRQEIVSRIVNAYPDAIWTRQPDLLNNDDLDKAIAELNSSVSLWHYINRADRLAGIGKYAVLLLGFDDTQKSEDFAKPVTVGRSRKLLYVQVYGYDSAPIQSYDEDPKSASFGLPLTYQIKPSSNDGSVVGAGNTMPTSRIRGIQPFSVHRDRILHIADCSLDSDIYGYPIIERVFNRLDDLEKVIGGSAEMFFQNGRGGLHLNMDKDVKMTPADEVALSAEVDDYINNVQRVLRTRGLDVNVLKSEGVNPAPVFNVIMSVISVATGIPQRIFIGSEQGKLASEQDRANWAVRINERRMMYAEPRVLRPLINRLQQFKVLPSGSYDVEWPEAFQLSPLERGQTAAQQARAATNMANTMTKQPRLINRREARSIVFARGELMKEGEITNVNDV